MTPLLSPQWPLFVIYPLSVAFWWTAYLRLADPVARHLFREQYDGFNAFNKMCFRQNMLSGLHTSLSAVCLGGALLGDGTLIFGEFRLYPHTSQLLYLDLSMSLGYFSYALPISVVMAKHGFPFGSHVMVLHHLFVVVAQSTFLLTRYPAGFMAASGFLFELTNVFFVPHVLLFQLDANRPKTRAILGLSLVVVYTLARCGACSALALLSIRDLSRFNPPSAGCWLAALLGMLCFYGLLLISWYWYFQAILPSLHAGLSDHLGETYYHACCPQYVRSFAWRWLTRDGREARRQLRALQELRQEVGTQALEWSRT